MKINVEEIKEMGLKTHIARQSTCYYFWTNFRNFTKSMLRLRIYPGMYYCKEEGIVITYKRTADSLIVRAARVSNSDDYLVPRMRGLLMAITERALTEKLNLRIEDHTCSYPVLYSRDFRYKGTLYRSVVNSWFCGGQAAIIRFTKPDGFEASLKVRSGEIIALTE